MCVYVCRCVSLCVCVCADVCLPVYVRTCVRACAKHPHTMQPHHKIDLQWCEKRRTKETYNRVQSTHAPCNPITKDQVPIHQPQSGYINTPESETSGSHPPKPSTQPVAATISAAFFHFFFPP